MKREFIEEQLKNVEKKLKIERVEACLNCKRFTNCENIGRMEECDDFLEVGNGMAMVIVNLNDYIKLEVKGNEN